MIEFTKFTFDFSPAKIREWVRERLEAKDRVVFKAIESSEFKSHPDEFKNVSDARAFRECVWKTININFWPGHVEGAQGLHTHTVPGVREAAQTEPEAQGAH